MKKLSIIVPVFNAAHRLKESINSILEQTYKNIEVILIDDGSTDKSLEICHEMRQQDDRIVVIVGKNHGVSYARNRGMETATGEYITFVDADDTIDKDMHLNMIIKLEQENQKMVICNYNSISPSGRIKRSRDLEGFTEDIISSKQLIGGLLTCGGNLIMGACWRFVFLRQHIVDHNIEFEKGIMICEDLLFVIRYLTTVDTCAICQGNYYQYFLRSDFTKKYMESHDIALERVDNLILDLGIQHHFDSETMLNIQMRRATTLVGDIKNICRRGSPYSLWERYKYAREKANEPDMYKSISIAAANKDKVVRRRHIQICLFKHHLEFLSVIFQSLRLFDLWKNKGN